MGSSGEGIPVVRFKKNVEVDHTDTTGREPRLSLGLKMLHMHDVPMHRQQCKNRKRDHQGLQSVCHTNIVPFPLQRPFAKGGGLMRDSR